MSLSDLGLLCSTSFSLLPIFSKEDPPGPHIDMRWSFSLKGLYCWLSSLMATFLSQPCWTSLLPVIFLILLSFQSSLCWLILALHAPTSFPTFLLSVFFTQFSFPLCPWSVGTWWVRSCSLLLLLYSFSLGACFHFMALPLTTSSPWCHWLPPDSRSKCSFDCVSPECPDTPLVPTSP